MTVRVLLVEDNDVFREALELMLGMRAGASVLFAKECATPGRTNAKPPGPRVISSSPIRNQISPSRT